MQTLISNCLLNLLVRTSGSCYVPNNFSKRSLHVEKTIMFQLDGKSEEILNFRKGLWNMDGRKILFQKLTRLCYISFTRHKKTAEIQLILPIS